MDFKLYSGYFKHRIFFFRSLIVPGWGQSYNRQPVKGLVFGGLAVATIGGAVAYHLMGAHHACGERQVDDRQAAALHARG